MPSEAEFMSRQKIFFAQAAIAAFASFLS